MYNNKIKHCNKNNTSTTVVASGFLGFKFSFFNKLIVESAKKIQISTFP